MTKQKEIREGLKEILGEHFDCRCVGMDEKGNIYPVEQLDTSGATLILNYLHSQGVVLKVKCPDCVWSQFRDETVGMTPCYRCNSTGYIVESLIEEG